MLPIWPCVLIPFSTAEIQRGNKQKLSKAKQMLFFWKIVQPEYQFSCASNAHRRNVCCADAVRLDCNCNLAARFTANALQPTFDDARGNPIHPQSKPRPDADVLPNIRRPTPNVRATPIDPEPINRLTTVRVRLAQLPLAQPEGLAAPQQPPGRLAEEAGLHKPCIPPALAILLQPTTTSSILNFS
jgi:hypothetical protein